MVKTFITEVKVCGTVVLVACDVKMCLVQDEVASLKETLVLVILLRLSDYTLI